MFLRVKFYIKIFRNCCIAIWVTSSPRKEGACLRAQCPAEQERNPVVGSMYVLLEIAMVRWQNIAESVYTRSYSKVLVISTHSFLFILVLDEAK